MSRRKLGIGKVRALQRASTPGGHFTILALDHQDALRRAMKPAAPETISTEAMIAFKSQVIQALAPECSGVLLDPIYGAAQSIESGALKKAALLVELEKADYALKAMPLRVELLPQWGVDKIKRMGADGVKLFFYYNVDDEEHALAQDSLLRKTASDCAHVDLPFYAEPILYRLDEPQEAYTASFSRRVTTAAKRVAALGADILKLEFPLAGPFDEAQARQVCEALSQNMPVPWVLLSAGVDFETYCKQVEAACRAGASGFIAGRAVWGEAAQIHDLAERENWLDTIGRERMHRLAEVAALGSPWTEKLGCEEVSADWYRAYQGWGL